MNKLRARLTLLAAGSLVCLSLVAPPVVHAVKISRPYEWTVSIDTKELPKQFEYQGSHIKPVVKCKMAYFKMTDEDEKVAYEDLWYSKARVLGLERHAKLDMTKGDAICIRVKHKTGSPTEDERKSAANAVMRTVVDVNLHKNMVATIKVPFDSFETISSEIQGYGFIALMESADTPVNSDMGLFLESEPEGQTRMLYHLH